MTAPKPDTFTDLDTLAAQGDGRLWYCRYGNVWSFPGAPLDPHANLRIPNENVPDARVRAALDAGAWIVAVLDNLAVPVRILAVVRAPENGADAAPLHAVNLGTAAAA